jgi:hypothetical protein
LAMAYPQNPNTKNTAPKEKRSPFYWSTEQRQTLVSAYIKLARDEKNTTEQKKNLKASAWLTLVGELQKVIFVHNERLLMTNYFLKFWQVFPDSRLEFDVPRCQYCWKEIKASFLIWKKCEKLSQSSGFPAKAENETWVHYMQRLPNDAGQKLQFACQYNWFFHVFSQTFI